MVVYFGEVEDQGQGGLGKCGGGEVIVIGSVDVVGVVGVMAAEGFIGPGGGGPVVDRFQFLFVLLM